MSVLKQSIPWARKFLMVLSSDHVTGATGKSITIKISVGPGGAGQTTTNTATELDSVNMPGWYQISLSPADNVLQGDLAFCASASGCDTAYWIDQVQTNVTGDLIITNGRLGINKNLLQNGLLSGFTFLMVDSTTGAPKTGLTVTSQVSLAGAAFTPSHFIASELANGIYTLSLAPIDLNANMTMLRLTAPGAADLDMGLIPTP